MKYKGILCAFIVTGILSASAQVASHASTPSAKVMPAKASASTAKSTIPQVSDKPVAKVNGSVLTDRDLLREMYAIFPYAQQHNGFPKNQEASIRQGALEMIIFEELVYQEAVRRNVVIPPQQIKAAELVFQRSFGSPDKYKEFLKVEMQGNPELVRAKIRRSMMIEAVLKSEIDSKSTVTMAETRAYYDKHPARFEQPESYAIQTISILPPRNLDPAKLSAQQKSDLHKRAEDALRQAKATKSYQDFGLLAEKISEDDFRVNMGEHKAVKLDELPPDVAKALARMKVGAVSDLFQVQDAYTIIRLSSHTPPQKMSFEQVKKPLQEELQKSKYEQTRSNLAKQLKSKAKVEIV